MVGTQPYICFLSAQFLVDNEEITLETDQFAALLQCLDLFLRRSKVRKAGPDDGPRHRNPGELYQWILLKHTLESTLRKYSKFFTEKEQILLFLQE
jgi:hypothetical protein